MGDYSLVKDRDENVCGFWLRDPNDWLQDADVKGDMKYFLLRSLAIKHQLSVEVYSAILNGNFRLVPNTVDSNGGKFLMFGSYPAPGEQSSSNQATPWWKFW